MIYVCMRVCIGRELLMRTYIFQVRACTLYISDIYRGCVYVVSSVHINIYIYIYVCVCVRARSPYMVNAAREYAYIYISDIYRGCV